MFKHSILFLVPLINAAISAGSWVVIDRSLKPVEDITRQVATIRQLSPR